MTTIIIATDGSLCAERAVHVGADIARSRNADVVVISAIDDRPIPDSLRAIAETEHLVERASEAHEPHLSNVPTWMMEGVHAAAQAEEQMQLRHVIADLAMEKARAILKEAGVENFKEEVGEGDATEIILRAAMREDAGMIVMGTRGIGAFKSLVYGSTSQEVAKEAACTCVTVT